MRVRTPLSFALEGPLVPPDVSGSRFAPQSEPTLGVEGSVLLPTVIWLWVKNGYPKWNPGK